MPINNNPSKILSSYFSDLLDGRKNDGLENPLFGDKKNITDGVKSKAEIPQKEKDNIQSVVPPVKLISPTLLSNQLFEPAISEPERFKEQEESPEEAQSSSDNVKTDLKETGDEKEIQKSPGGEFLENTAKNLVGESLERATASSLQNIQECSDEENVGLEKIDPRLLVLDENGRPPWAKIDFDALLLEINNFKIAVPLITLGHIDRISENLTPLFGWPQWFMGLQQQTGGQIKVVDTARFIMPEKYDPAFSEVAQYVVLIADTTWGLAVSKVNQPIRLKPDSVRWRKPSTTKARSQPWAAGVVKDHMCILIDVPRLGQMLVESNQKGTV